MVILLPRCGKRTLKVLDYPWFLRVSRSTGQSFIIDFRVVETLSDKLAFSKGHTAQGVRLFDAELLLLSQPG